MNILLDTHVFLWFIDGNSNLKERVRSLILDSNNQRFLSVASLWELAIKRSLGKLKLDFSFTELMMEHVQGNDIQILHIKPGHLDVVNRLPFHHRDPFDRLIIAKAIYEKMPVVSKDGHFSEYEIQNLWPQT